MIRFNNIEASRVQLGDTAECNSALRGGPAASHPVKASPSSYSQLFSLITAYSRLFSPNEKKCAVREEAAVVKAPCGALGLQGQRRVQPGRTGSKQVRPNPTMSNHLKSAFVGLRRDEPNEFAS
jgi:hypothetical protein